METKDKAAVSAAQLELGDDTFSLSPMDKGTASFAGGQAGCIKPVVTPDALSGLSLPIDGLADDTQEVIQAYADGYQCNRDFVTAAVFAAVSAAVGKKIRTHDGRYENQLSLFVCLVAPSGSNKTTPVREILRPLSDRDAANYKKFKAEMERYDKEVKAGNENAVMPVYRQLIIGDCTPEARNKVLAENSNALLVSDEVATMMYNVNRYTKSGELPQLLSIWSGENINVNRKSDLPVLIENPCLSVIGGTQPDVLADIFGTKFLMQSGFNQRWLFVYPDEEPPVRYCESRVADEISSAWEQYILGLCDLNPTYNTLRISDEAKKIYADYYDKLQVKKAGACGYMSAVYSKLQILVERWAGIAHLLGRDPTVSNIAPEEMEYAVRCMDYFERCAEKVYMKLTEGRNQPEAKATGNEEMIARLFFAYNPKSIQAFADGLGVSRQLVSRCLTKYEWLRGCGCGSTQLTENAKDVSETGATT